MKKTLLICIMCLVAALCMCLSACNPEEHTHSFTSGEYQSTASGHKQKCTGCDEYGDEEKHAFDADGKCTVCGFEKQEGEEHKHDFTSGEFQTSEAGHKQKCKDDDTYGPEEKHAFDADGKCTVCGYKKHTHDFTSGKFQTSENGHKQKCKDCDEYEETETPHTFDADGKKCTVCGYEKKDTEPTHHLTKVEAKQPSCTEEGNIEYYTCSDSACKGKFFDEKGNELKKENVVLGKVAHDFTSNEYSKTDKGHRQKCKNCDTYEETEHDHVFDADGKKCTVCGYEKKESGEHTHNLTKVEAKQPTCTEEGNKEYYTCDGKDCVGKYFDEDGNEIKDVFLAKLNHDFTSKQYSKTDKGHKQKCANCDTYEETEHPHEYEEGSTTCKVCGYEQQEAEGECEYTYAGTTLKYKYSSTTNSATVVGFVKEPTKVVIPEAIVTDSEVSYPVTAIADNALDCNNNTTNYISELVIPNTITSIGKYAFRYCTLKSLVIGPNITDHIDNCDRTAFSNTSTGELKLYFNGTETQYLEFKAAITEKSWMILPTSINDDSVYLREDESSYSGSFGIWKFQDDNFTPSIVKEHTVAPVVLPESIYGTYEYSGGYMGKETLKITKEGKLYKDDNYYHSVYTIVGYSNGTLNLLDDDETLYSREATATYDESAGTIKMGYSTYTRVEEKEDDSLPESIYGKYEGDLGTVTIDKENLTVTVTVSGFDMVCTIKSYSSGEAVLDWLGYESKLTYNESTKTIHVWVASSDYGEFTKVEESGGDENDKEAFKVAIDGEYTCGSNYTLKVNYPKIEFYNNNLGYKTNDYTITEFDEGTFSATDDARPSDTRTGKWTEKDGITEFRGNACTKQQAEEAIPSWITDSVWKSTNGAYLVFLGGNVGDQVERRRPNWDSAASSVWTIESFEEGTIKLAEVSGGGGDVTITYDESNHGQIQVNGAVYYLYET